MFRLIVEGKTIEHLCMNLRATAEELEEIGTKPAIEEKESEKVDTAKPEEVETTNEVANEPEPVETKESDFSELDSEGIPWDERIHAANKSKVADGSWKIKRGADRALVARIKDELKKVTPEVVQEPAKVVTPEPVQEVPKVMPSPIAKEPFTYSYTTFKNDIAVIINDLINAGRITPDYIEQVKSYFEVKEIYHIFNDEVKLKEFYDNLIGFQIIKGL